MSDAKTSETMSPEHQGRVNWILEADIVSFFDRVDRTALIEILRGRIPDESLLRLVGKCLRVGVLDGVEYSEPGVGTVQGSMLSNRCANVIAPVRSARRPSGCPAAPEVRSYRPPASICPRLETSAPSCAGYLVAYVGYVVSDCRTMATAGATLRESA